MRQDAVMQQFFALINNVLQESPDTQKRKLRIVTYKVCCFLAQLLSQPARHPESCWCLKSGLGLGKNAVSSGYDIMLLKTCIVLYSVNTGCSQHVTTHLHV